MYREVKAKEMSVPAVAVVRLQRDVVPFGTVFPKTVLVLDCKFVSAKKGPHLGDGIMLIFGL